MQEKLIKEEAERLVREIMNSDEIQSLNTCSNEMRMKFFFYGFCNYKVAVESLEKEREARINFERSQATLSDDLGRAQRDLQSANQKVK